MTNIKLSNEKPRLSKMIKSFDFFCKLKEITCTFFWCLALNNPARRTPSKTQTKSYFQKSREFLWLIRLPLVSFEGYFIRRIRWCNLFFDWSIYSAAENAPKLPGFPKNPRPFSPTSVASHRKWHYLAISIRTCVIFIFT